MKIAVATCNQRVGITQALLHAILRGNEWSFY